jgi:hypothetical protein
MTLYLDDMRGVKAQQDGEDIADAALIRTLNFRGQTVEYNAASRVLTVGPELTTTRAEVELATTAALPANTRNGNTLTANANGVLTVDGVTPTTNQRILVKDEVTAANNGWYFVSDPGVASVAPWQLTRSADADASAEFVSGAISRVLAGTVNAGRSYVLTVGGGFVLNTDAVTFTLYNLNAVEQGTDEGDRPEFDGTTYVPRRFWITPDIDLTGSVDATATINAALNTRDGACVYIPEGIIKLAGQIVLGRQGNTLTGPERSFKQPTKIFNNGYISSGTLFNVTHTGVAFLWDDANCGVHNVEVYYPNQDMTPASTALGSLTAYDYTFHVQADMHGASLTNITAHNAYRLLKFEAGGGKIDTIKGFPLFRGVTFPRCGAAPDMQNVQFNGVGDYSQDATLEAWVKANGTAYLLDGIEGYSFRNCKALGYNVGLRFYDEDNDGFTGVYGEWYGLGLEGCNTCILVDQPSRTYQPLAIIGGKFTDCTLVPELSGLGIDFADTVTPANFANRPGMIFNGLTFHSGAAGATRAIWIRSGSYAHVTWKGGNAHYMGGEHLCRMDSATGFFSAENVTTPAGSTRTSNGGGTVSAVQDRHGYVQEIGSGGTRYFDDFWDAEYYVAGRTTAIGSTNLFASTPPKGLWEVDMYVAITTTGSAGTIDAYISSTDDIGSNSQSFSTSVTATNRGRQRYVVETNGATNMAIETIHTGVTGSPAYSIRVTARRVSKTT